MASSSRCGDVRRHDLNKPAAPTVPMTVDKPTAKRSAHQAEGKIGIGREKALWDDIATKAYEPPGALAETKRLQEIRDAARAERHRAERRTTTADDGKPLHDDLSNYVRQTKPVPPPYDCRKIQTMAAEIRPSPPVTHLQ